MGQVNGPKNNQWRVQITVLQIYRNETVTRAVKLEWLARHDTWPTLTCHLPLTACFSSQSGWTGRRSDHTDAICYMNTATALLRKCDSSVTVVTGYLQDDRCFYLSRSRGFSLRDFRLSTWLIWSLLPSVVWHRLIWYDITNITERTHCVGVVGKALCYNPESCGFETRLFFSLQFESAIRIYIL
jgi:hypothetical protein